MSGTVEVREPPEREVADMAVLVRLLSQWMHMFPYDFRDDRVMALVRSITQRYDNTKFQVYYFILSDRGINPNFWDYTSIRQFKTRSGL